jgi:hypothetical protein
VTGWVEINPDQVFCDDEQWLMAVQNQERRDMSNDNTQGGSGPYPASAGSDGSETAIDSRTLAVKLHAVAAAACYGDQAIRGWLHIAANHIAMHNMGITGCGRWIPVTERMPDVERSQRGSVECIVACSTGLVTAMRYTENRGAKTEKGRRPRWEWNWRVATWEVTHWMPLPAPPETSK